jgi:hypothetical protein
MRAGGVMKVLGIVLVVVGLVGLIYGGVSWTHREKVVDLGPLEVSHDKHDSAPISPIAGGIALVAGVVLLMKKTGAA